MSDVEDEGGQPLPKRKCVVCRDARLPEIEKVLARPRSERETSRQFGYSTNTLRRHRDHMTTDSINKALSSTAGLTEIAEMKARAEDAAKRARKKGDIRAELLAERERRSALELELRLQQGPGADDQAIIAHPSWQLFLKKLLGIVNECATCKSAIIGIVPGDTRSE